MANSPTEAFEAHWKKVEEAHGLNRGGSHYLLIKQAWETACTWQKDRDREVFQWLMKTWWIT